MAGKYPLTTAQKHAPQARREHLDSEKKSYRRDKHLPVQKKGELFPVADLQPAHLQQLQNNAGNRATIQAMGRGPAVIQRGWFDNILGAVSDIGGGGGGIGGMLSNLGGSAMDMLGGGGGGIGGMLSNLGGSAMDMLGGGGGGIGGMLSNLGGSAINMLGGGGMADQFSNAARQGMDWLYNAGSRGVEEVGNIAGQGMDLASRGAETLWNRGMRGASNIWDMATENIPGVGLAREGLREVKQTARQGMDLAGQGAEWLWNQGSQGAENLWNTGAGVASDAWDWIQGGVENSGLGQPFDLDSLFG